jgi:integrase
MPTWPDTCRLKATERNGRRSLPSWTSPPNFGTGSPHHQRNALRAIVAAAEKAKLGHVTAHDLRHSLVANALDAGLTLTEASRLARHATPAVTATVYADVLEAKRGDLGAKLAKAGFGV